MSARQAFHALAELACDDTPCTKLDCSYRQRCADKEQACEVFRVYVETGRCVGSPAEPTRAMYERVTEQ